MTLCISSTLFCLLSLWVFSFRAGSEASSSSTVTSQRSNLECNSSNCRHSRSMSSSWVCLCRMLDLTWSQYSWSLSAENINTFFMIFLCHKCFGEFEFMQTSEINFDDIILNKEAINILNIKHYRKCFYIVLPWIWKNNGVHINDMQFMQATNWASSWDYGTYHIGDQQRRTGEPAHLRCLPRAFAVRTWSMEVDEGSDQKSDILPHWMAAHPCLKNVFTEDKKYHNFMRRLN